LETPGETRRKPRQSICRRLGRLPGASLTAASLALALFFA